MQEINLKKITKSLYNEWLWPLAVFFCAFSYFIRFTDYGLFHGETIIIGSILAVIALILGYLYCCCGWIGRVIIFSSTITMVVSFFPGFGSLLTLTAVFLITVILAIYCIEKLPAIINIMALCFILSTLLLPVGNAFNKAVNHSNPASTHTADLPPIVHIILDEHEGISGLPEDIMQTALLKKQLMNFYVKYGFVLYDNAYSHFARTINSIPNLINFTAIPENRAYFHNAKAGTVLRDSAYFKTLSKQGYQIRVYQSDFLSYCAISGVSYKSCYTYPSHSIKYSQVLPLSLRNRTKFLGKSFILSSSLYQYFVMSYDNKLVPLMAYVGVPIAQWPWYQDQVSVLPTLDIFKQLQKDMRENSNGIVFFAHILLPHSPYIYAKHCHPVLNPDKWDVNYNLGGAVNTVASRQSRYKAYAAQVSCAYDQLTAVFDVMKKAGIYDKAIIIVNGDHGSRIVIHPTTVEERGQLTSQDLHDAYQTLFAVKLPKRIAKIDHSQLAINDLLAKVTAQITGQAIPLQQDEHYVYLAAATPEVVEEIELNLNYLELLLHQQIFQSVHYYEHPSVD